MAFLNLNYHISGTGSIPILLIHGWGGSHQSWHNIVHSLDLPVTWWAIDLPGHGKSPLSSAKLTIDDYCQAVVGFIETQRLRPQVIIAHSMGGLIALKLAYTRPDLFRQMVLINPVVTGAFGYDGSLSRFLRTGTGAVFGHIMKTILPVLQNKTLMQTLLNRANIDPNGKRALEEDFTAMKADAAVEVLFAMANETMQPVLTEIVHPTLVAVGTHDMTVPPSESAIAAHYLPNAELAVFEQARHRPHDTQKTAFTQRLRDFLNRHGIGEIDHSDTS